MQAEIHRLFLGWSRPALESVEDVLWQRYVAASIWELSRVVVVVPGARAGRRLSEALAARAEREQVVFFPPEITTVGQLPELLYQCHRPFASVLVQQLAWSDVLRNTDVRILNRFLSAVPTTPKDPRWWELGALLRRQHRELAADGLNFSDAASAGSELTGFSGAERIRWEALAHIQQAYLDRLDQLGLWDRQTARLFAIKHHECQTESELWLLGTVDLNRAQRMMLDQVRQQVTAIVYADDSWRQSFDEYGCLCPERWRETEFALREDQIRIAERPTDQANEVVRFLAELQGRYAADQISIGVPDESLVPLLERRLRQAGVPARFGPGRSVEASRPVRLLRALIQFATSRRLEDLIDLLRHPDLTAWLRARSTETVADIARLDHYCSERLITTVDQATLGSDEVSQGARRIIDQVADLLTPLDGPDRPPEEWVSEILGVLTSVYGSLELDPDDASDRMILGGCEALREGLLELQRLPGELSLPVQASEAFLMAVASLPVRQISAPADPEAVELLGWLELPLDDAPVLVVTQANEGAIPTSANSDLFLPDTLRSHLGLDDNARRYARDAYAFTVLVRTRKQFAVIVGRRDDQGNPLLPSRLLFATNDEHRANRCLRFFGDPSPEQGPESMDDGPADEAAADGAAVDEVAVDEVAVDEVAVDGVAVDEVAVDEVAVARETPGPSHRFSVPRPSESVRVDTLNVTDFRAYLECPYRFYLARLLRLESVVREPVELDGAAFGTLVHDVMERFGATSGKNSEDAEEICEQLLSILHNLCVQRYGADRRPAVQIQQAQLRQRLQAFAQRQAIWRKEGWEIVLTEGECRAVTTTWLVDGSPIKLRGRIDRIDRHEGTGHVAILDYKTSEEGRSPRSVHNVGSGRGPAGPDQWRDLQLPLYRHLVGELGIDGPVRLGFITLPRELDGVGFKMADWSEQELAAADEVARQVVRAIRQRVFWEPAEPEVSFDPGLDRICQVNVFDRQLAGPVDARKGDEQ